MVPKEQIVPVVLVNQQEQEAESLSRDSVTPRVTMPLPEESTPWNTYRKILMLLSTTHLWLTKPISLY